ncbi:hypothetical protein OHS33_18830 [Streptomyces sp. NBC_00536]|uniref:hypothetical protein n=1 Tax=Streptomyces sp. NBC_00536 TaxID=2975769 RepID=UPI002E81D19D|nr:hypothetical protein [Streptomyces sp. NBC_00536]WUC80217.1 hypothetical protein OHS33_18830 [Streptomyces sp. NBC_00536]
MRKGPLTLLAVCVTAATLTGCGGPPRDGYVAVGAAAQGPERGAGETVAPKGAVEYQPLGSPSAAGPSAQSTSTSPSAPGNQPPGGSGAGGAVPGAPTGSASAPVSTATGGSTGGSAGGSTGASTGGSAGGSTGGSTGTPGTTSGGSGSTGGSGGTGTPTAPVPQPPAATPARLQLGAPARSAAADRWCERVGVTFTNTGSTAARSGTVTFSTHIIGALGIDWATITSAQPLPAPIAGGSAKTQTYTVCVESWRVPLGMHIETQRVTATWS